MKKLIILAGLVWIGMTGVTAQDFKLAKSTGTLDIREVNHVVIEGYAGNEIVFSRDGGGDHDRDERAKGLRVVSSLGLEDNTGLGISVLDKGTVIEVRQLKKMGGPEIRIKVPKGVTISYTHSSPHGNELRLTNVEGPIDVSTVHNSVYLDNVSGPVEVKTVHGGVDAVFSDLKNKIEIESVHGHVDVAIPVAVKANLRLGTHFGEILVDKDIKIEMNNSGEMVKYSDNVTGKMNGGGLSIDLSSSHGNVYLRKKS